MKVCSSRADLRSLSFILFSHSFAHSLRKRKAFSRVSSFLIKKMHFQSADWHFLLKKEGHHRLKERRIRNFFLIFHNYLQIIIKEKLNIKKFLIDSSFFISFFTLFLQHIMKEKVGLRAIRLQA